ncbi:MAG TPA: phosphotransferase [Stellaceae bacterium]|nr:phosphotransferase [Stellaceae bacterium]
MPSAADPLDSIRALPIWRGRIEIAPLGGGLSNRNYLVADGERRCVVRVGDDVPVHGVRRSNEHAASRAAAAAGIAPAVIHTAPGLLVVAFIEGRTYRPEDVRANRDRCVALVRRLHRELPDHIRHPYPAFDAVQAIRAYGSHLAAMRSAYAPALPRLLAIAAGLEAAAGRLDPVPAHNDLLAANIIDDGKRLWLIDWEYAGFNTPLFDLGGLATNNGFAPAEEEAMLEAYFEQPVSDGLRRRFHAVKCVSLLREAMWSMVSELHSALEFDYAAYTAENLRRFEAAWAGFAEMAGS